MPTCSDCRASCRIRSSLLPLLLLLLPEPAAPATPALGSPLAPLWLCPSLLPLASIRSFCASSCSSAATACVHCRRLVARAVSAASRGVCGRSSVVDRRVESRSPAAAGDASTPPGPADATSPDALLSSRLTPPGEAGGCGCGPCCCDGGGRLTPRAMALPFPSTCPARESRMLTRTGSRPCSVK